MHFSIFNILQWFCRNAIVHFCVGYCIIVLLCVICIADEKGKFDELVEDKGVKVLIDPRALMHVIGTKMDFVEDRLK